MTLKYCNRIILAALLAMALPTLAVAQFSVDVSVNVPPPELPVYDQPPIPGDGYIWTPGYWAWGDDVQDYYWVPGTWVAAPQPNYLWTPGYWGWQGGAFLWNAGYWGTHVGFYGGVNYGYGYGGSGFDGGYWQDGRMYYNRSVTNISTTNITNVYNKTVINNVTENRASYNGGNGGVRAQPRQPNRRRRRKSVLPPCRRNVSSNRPRAAIRRCASAATMANPRSPRPPVPGSSREPGSSQPKMEGP